LNIYETINSYHKYGKELKLLSFNKNFLPSTLEELSKKLKEFKKTNCFDTKLNIIRNHTIGHISKDFKKYYDCIKSIDEEEAFKMIKDFNIILNEIYDFSLHCLLDKPLEEKIDIQEEFNKLKSLFDENIP